jgi:hypothetical protein
MKISKVGFWNMFMTQLGHSIQYVVLSLKIEFTHADQEMRLVRELLRRSTNLNI